MHELPIIKEVLEIVLKYAEEQNAKTVNKVTLTIGELHDLIPEWVERFFHFASKGTIAQGAKLVINQTPIICRCNSCHEHFILHKNGSQPWACPVCKEESFEFLSGKEFIVDQIEFVSGEK